MARKFSTNRGVGRKSRHTLLGGPLHGATVTLCSPGTLTFTCKGQTGRYNESGQWVESKVC